MRGRRFLYRRQRNPIFNFGVTGGSGRNGAPKPITPQSAAIQADAEAKRERRAQRNLRLANK